MSRRIMKSTARYVLTGWILLLLGSVVTAGELTLTYIGPDGNNETLSIDTTSSIEDLNTVTALLGANGASIIYNADEGMGSLVDIAKTLTEVSPEYAADIAQALAAIARDQSDEIVAAVNSVAGVNTNAVLAAVHFGPPIRISEPSLDQDFESGFGTGGIDIIPSQN